jgi:galactokinase
VPRERARAFAPGRVNLIGEHTDYNGGLALPFAISQGVVVDAVANEDRRVRAYAVDLDEEDDFGLDDRSRVTDWRAFARGAVAVLAEADVQPPGALLQIGGDLPRGAGLSSSAALEVALCIALLALAGRELDRLALARLCSRIENEWVGAQTGLLDQLASLFGEAEHALLIDFAALAGGEARNGGEVRDTGEAQSDGATARAIAPVPLRLHGWRLVVLDSGERHSHAGGDYNARRAECERARELLGVRTLSAARVEDVARLPAPLRERAEHVLSENERVRAATNALRKEDLPALGALLNESHASLRDLYAVSTPAVEATVRRLLDAGAAGARIVGGGFGGCVLALFSPGAAPPPGALEVRPGPGAHLLDA